MVENPSCHRKRMPPSIHSGILLLYYLAYRSLWCRIQGHLRRGSPVASTLLHLKSFLIQGQLLVLNFSPQGFKKADGCLVTGKTYR